MPPFGRAVTPMVVPCGVSVIDCSGLPASCCGGGCCSTQIMVRPQPRRPRRSLGSPFAPDLPDGRAPRQRRPGGHEWHRRQAPARSVLGPCEYGATLEGEDNTRHVRCLTAGRKSHDPVRLAVTTWNINSVRLRLPHVRRFLAEAQPDVLCLQETKCPDDRFPAEGLRSVDHPHLAYAGQKGYNGVAILSRLPFRDRTVMGMCGRDDARH